MLESSTLRRPRLTYFLCILVACVAAASSFLGFSYGLFFSFFAAASTAVLFRLYHPAAAAVAPILAFLIMGAIFGFSFGTLLLSFMPSAAGITLAMSLRRGENRLSLAVSATVSVLLIALAYAALVLYSAAREAGASDMLSYLTTLLDACKEWLVSVQLESYETIAKMLEARDIAYTMPTEDTLASLASQMMALTPALFLSLTLLLSLALTYAVQLLAVLLDDRSLFDGKNAVYGLGPLAAGAYLLVSIITLFYVDFSSPFYLVCISTAWVLAPLFVLNALFRAPRLVSFIRRMSRGAFDFAVWIILFALCILSYLAQVFVFLAIWQALHILISALRARRKPDRH